MEMQSKSVRLKRMLIAGVAICVAGGGRLLAQTQGVAGTAAQAADAKEWPTIGHDSGGMRFSPLTQINPANVGSLTVAWTYHMKQEGDSVGGGRGPGGPGGPGGRGGRGRGGPPPDGAPGAPGLQPGDQVSLSTANAST